MLYNRYIIIYIYVSCIDFIFYLLHIKNFYYIYFYYIYYTYKNLFNMTMFFNNSRP